MQPRGILRYAQRTSKGNAMNMAATFPFLRRIDLYSAMEELVSLDQEVKTTGKLFGIPLVLGMEGYNGVKAKRAKAKLRAKLNNYRTPLVQASAQL